MVFCVGSYYSDSLLLSDLLSLVSLHQNPCLALRAVGLKGRGDSRTPCPVVSMCSMHSARTVGLGQLNGFKLKRSGVCFHFSYPGQAKKSMAPSLHLFYMLHCSISDEYKTNSSSDLQRWTSNMTLIYVLPVGIFWFMNYTCDLLVKNLIL